MVTLVGEGTVVLTTPRLVLRTFRSADLPPYAALNADPEVARYLGGPISRQTSDEIAEWANEHYAQDRLGLLAIERREDGQFIGMCGVHEQDWYPDDVEIGWRLARAYWGCGYVTEAAQAWLAYVFEGSVFEGSAFSDVGRTRVISITDLDNARSIAVMHRLGLVFDHTADLPDEDTGEPFPAVIHAITEQQWRSGADRLPCACQTRSSPGT